MENIYLQITLIFLFFLFSLFPFFVTLPVAHVVISFHCSFMQKGKIQKKSVKIENTDGDFKKFIIPVYFIFLENPAKEIIDIITFSF